jgi:hypothetical protein
MSLALCHYFEDSAPERIESSTASWWSQKGLKVWAMRDSNARPLAPEGAGGYPPAGFACY